MKIVTAQEMQDLDRQAIEGYGIPGLLLMENAGIGALTEMTRHYGSLQGKTVTVLAGKGNNGGDGFVIARHLHQRGARVSVFLIGQKERVRDDARVNLHIYEKIGGELRELGAPNSTEQFLAALQGQLRQSDLVVDAIFGTGMTRLRPGASEAVDFQAIDLINQSGKRVVAVDIPSGISSDTGAILQSAVKADLTVSFGLPKRGHYLYPGAAYRGMLRVVDIGIPQELVRRSKAQCALLTSREISKNLPGRPRDAHKGRFGHVLVIAGSVGKTGAAAMASLSALRTGAGLVTLATPRSLNAILEEKLTEVMTVPLPETSAQSVALSAEKEIVDLSQSMACVILGPGLSTHPETQELVRKLISSLRLPIVLDADGINALVGHTDLFKKYAPGVILTPHPGEMARLLGVTSEKIQADRIATVQSFAQQHRAFLILKGAYSVLGGPDASLFINPTGNEGMATGGTGDVLSGMLGGFLAQGLGLLEAAQVGIFLHGLAGDLAAAQKGTTGMIAGDLIGLIPAAIRNTRHAPVQDDPYDPFSP